MLFISSRAVAELRVVLNRGRCELVVRSWLTCNIYMLCAHSECQPVGQLPFLPCMMTSWKTNKQNNIHIFSCFPLFTYLCLSLFLLLFVSHFSFVFCLICLPSANAFHPRVCGLQPLQPSGLQQPPTGRELRRFQQGNELMEGFGKIEKGDGCRLRGRKVRNSQGAKIGENGNKGALKEELMYTKADGEMMI